MHPTPLHLYFVLFSSESNVNIPGVWMFQIGNTGPDGDIKAADMNTGKGKYNLMENNQHYLWTL